MTNKRRRTPGRRSHEESARTRSRLLDRAEELFARRGYEGVSLRELARDCGVQLFTVQHHFGSKLALYQEALCRWDAAVLDRVAPALREPGGLPELVERVTEDLFDFFLEKRHWMALNARAVLGEDLPPGVEFEERSWVAFIDAALRGRQVEAALDTGLLMITIEGLLNSHVLAGARYRRLFGRDVTDAELKARTVAHLKQVILALLGVSDAPPARRSSRRRARARGAET